MMNSNSFFTVKNAGLLLIVSSIFLSFTNPNEIKNRKSYTKKSQTSWQNFFATNNIDNNNENKKNAFVVNPPLAEQSKSTSFLLPNTITNNKTVHSYETNINYNSSDGHEGVIGSLDKENWNDEPSDNIYNINLIQYDKRKKYSLIYSVKGLANASSVTRSINKSLALGGYIVSKNESWTTVSEDIDPTLLQQGNNQILYNSNSKDYYRIKEVRIVESNKNNSAPYQITSSITKDNSVYIKGFFQSDSGINAVEISGEKANIVGHEFEFFKTINANENNLAIEFLKNDGSRIKTKLSKSDIATGNGINSFIQPEKKIIDNNSFGMLLGLRTVDLPPVEASITNVNKEYSGYRFKSSVAGKKTIHLPYDKNEIPKGFHESDISTFYFDYSAKKWQRLKIDSIDVEHQLVILTNEENKGGETDYVNGIIKNPESPETTSFAPTITNDVPVANPTSKINMISPPTANQQGSANVSYPIEIPAGINGFQPNVSINYNSDSKTGGWAGLGWDVPLETIDIDTRWGVPEFNSTKESEIYTINGEQLVFDDTYLPNKTPSNLWKDRVSGDNQFYFRIGVKEGTKIIRKGTNTTNYTWEVTDDDGNVKKYNDVLKDGSGNNVRWFLTSVSNKYGHQAITYAYEDLSYNNGKNKYLKSINYSNNTTIEFTNSGGQRPDVTSSYKLGVKISEFKLLNKIEVKRAGTIVREYQLKNDATGDFGKSLLLSITQKKGSEEFNKHVFDYTKRTPSSEFDPENTNLDLFSKYSKNITSSSDGLTSGNYDRAKMSLISGTQGKSENYKGSFTLGYGFGVSGNKKRTGGVNYTYAENENFGKTQLFDIDGDGLPDKVFYKDGGSIQFRKNTEVGFSGLSTINGFTNVPLSKNNAYINSYGIEASFKVIQGGLTFSTTKGNSPIYFSDVNGDGLPDLLYYGKAYFNKLRLNGSNVVNNFAAVEDNIYALSDTPNAILKGINAPETTIPEEESKLLANIVRVWEAPNTGIVSISNNISLEQNSTDGVDVWLEKGSLMRSNENNSNIPISSLLGSKITLNNLGQSQILNAYNILIEKGQRIYIIASSKEKPKGDKIKIESSINYTYVAEFNNQLNIKDINENDFFKFNYKNSFIKSSSKGNAIGEKGKTIISWQNLTSQKFSDDVNFKIYKLEKKFSDTTDLGTSENRQLIFHQKLKRGDELNKLLPDENLVAGVDIENLQLNSASSDSNPLITFLYFEVTSDTNVAWDKINWNPTVTTTTDQGIQNLKMEVNYKTFAEVVKLGGINPNNQTFNSRLRIYPKFTSCYDVKLAIPNSIPNANETEVTFSIKFKNYSTDGVNFQPVYTLKKKVKIVGNYMEIPYVDNYANNPQYSYIEYAINTNNYGVAKYLSDLDPNIEIISNECFTIPTTIKSNYYSTRSETKHYNLTTGNMWQGWGGFVYNGSKYPSQTLKEQDFAIAPLEEGDFPLPNCGNDPDSPTYESCMLDYINQQNNSRYFTSLTLDQVAENYSSPMESAFLSKDYMQPYNLLAHKPSETFEGDPKFVTANPSGIIMHSYGKSLNVYGGIGPFNVSGGRSNDDNSEHFMDFNGDQYPDVIIDNKYYKTDITGGLKDFIVTGNKTINNKTRNFGIGGAITKSINPEKNSNTQTSGASSWGELYSQMGSSFSATGSSVSASLGTSGSNNSNIWLDINGDSLVDYISGGQVYINNGKDFNQESGWDNLGDDVFRNETEAISGGGGVNFGKGSWVVGVGKNFSNSKNTVFFIDLTGDGLVDKLVRNPTNDNYNLFFNTGSSFSSNPIGIKNFQIENNQNSSGFNFYGTACVAFGLKICLSLGYGTDKSTNKQTVDLRDFNGDGLPDVLISTNDTQMTVIENQADKFNLLSSITNPIGGTMSFSYNNRNTSTQQKLGNTYQMPFTKQALVRVDFSGYENSTSIDENNKSLPAASRYYYFEYENGVQDRRERAFLGFGKVTTKDMEGITQVTEYETNYLNANDFYVPYNDTSVRKYFYKKGLVKSTYTLDNVGTGRQRQRVDYEYRYFDQTSTTGYILNEDSTEPIFKDIGRIIPFLYKTKTTTTEYSGNTSHTKTTTAIINEYNEFGNIKKYTDLGATDNNTSDDIKVSIAYHPVTSQNVGGIPQEHLVTNAAGIVLRKSQTEINQKGDIEIIKRFIGTNFAEYKYEYDTYGNIIKTTLPKNPGETDADRMFYTYTYDPTYKTYVTSVTDARGLSSSTTYDTSYLLGLPISITDTNGSIATYEYDSFGRMTKYRAPTDFNSTIILRYYKNNDFNSPVAVTEKKAPIVNGVAPSINYFTSIYVNGWGEEIASKKLYGGVANNYIYTYTQSPLKDLKGRVIKSYVNKLAAQESGTILDRMQNFSPENNQILNLADFKDYFVTYEYDELDRPIKSVQKGVITNTGTSDLTTETQYGFGADRNGVLQFTKKTISPKGLSSIVYTDEKGRTTATKQTGDNKDLWVSYSYDLLNQISEVKDQNSNKMEFTYDQLGRRITENHPDAGLTTYEYDYKNNLVFTDNPVLRGLNKKIEYKYNKFNQLTNIIYPKYSVTYEYGGVNAPDFGAGRLIKQTDHTGIKFFKYNQLGQIIEDRRYMVAPNAAPKVFKTNYTYDLFNRINKIIYPDNEEVFYNYTPFGLLDNIKSKAPGDNTQQPIISNIAYNYNEQTMETTAGNGTKTQYAYDPWGRLEELALLGTSEIVKTNTYLFDKDNNIAKLTTAVPMTAGIVKNDIAIASDKTFEYDGFNRLKKSVIKASGKAERKYYELEMAYTDMHSIANKNSRWKVFNGDPSVCQNPSAMGDKMVYYYEDRAHPNAVSSIDFNSPNSGTAFTTPWDCRTGIDIAPVETKQLYTYDANGNMIKVEDQEFEVGEIGMETPPNIRRKLFWDAQNRMKGISEAGALHHYVYDEEGQRALKSEGASRALRTDGNERPDTRPTVMGSYQYYPNGYMVVNDRQVSKHYYIGANKVAARVGDVPSHGFASGVNSDLLALSDVLKLEVEGIVTEAAMNPILWPNPSTGDVRESEEDCAGFILREAEKYPVKSTCYKKLMAGYNNALLAGGFCSFWQSMQTDACLVDQPTEELHYQTYWTHPDHLGSSSVITNQNGSTTNWYEYMPFGEMLMEQNNGDYNNVYKYNGKELDEATGLYYYGARYMDPRTSIWLSVDPLAVYNPVMESEFYGDGQHNGGVFYSGNLNPYIYTYQNPIRYIDPNGKQTESYATKSHDDNDMSQVVTIRGGRYYQNTTNTPAIAANSIISFFGGPSDYFVEKKPYNGADNSFIHEAVDTSVGTLIGGGIGKIADPLLGNIASKISNRFIPNAGKLLNSMLAPSKGGMSAIGRALQKHAGRAGSSFENVIYSGKTATEDAMKIVNDIVTSKPMIDLEKNGTKTFYDKATGRGFNVNRQGEFGGFRELSKREVTNVQKVLKK